jgi:hypothetical protein
LFTHVPSQMETPITTTNTKAVTMSQMKHLWRSSGQPSSRGLPRRGLLFPFSS